MDSLNQALIDCVRAAGGSKVVGPALWPEKMADAAQRLLLDCLNEDRPAHLTPEQMAFVFSMAKQRGFHGGIGYLLSSLGYAPTVPLEPKDEAGELMRQVIEGQRSLSEKIDRLNKLQPSLRAVA